MVCVLPLDTMYRSGDAGGQYCPSDLTLLQGDLKSIVYRTQFLFSLFYGRLLVVEDCWSSFRHDSSISKCCRLPSSHQQSLIRRCVAGLFAFFFFTC